MMDALKSKVIDELEAFLDDRLAGRLKPKAVQIDMMALKKPGMDDEAAEGPEGSPQEEATESPAEEKQEDGDESKLSPEEKAELEQLYAKMGR